MPHHDSSSNYWLMLFSSSVLATRHCSCCRGDKALLVFTEFENIHIKPSRIGKNGQEGWAAQEEQIRISFELFEISKCNLENWSTLKPINDGCVHGKKKKGQIPLRWHLLLLWLVFPPLQPLWHTVGGKWKVLFAFCKYHINLGFSLQDNLRVRGLSQLFPVLLFITISLIFSAFRAL